MKLRYLFPFFFLGVTSSFSQELDSLISSFEKSFLYSEHKKELLYGTYLPSREGDTSKVFKAFYDIHPKDGMVDLEAYFEIISYDSKTGLLTFKQNAFMIQKDFNGDRISNVILQDVDRNGTLETVIWNDRKVFSNKDKVSVREKEK